MYARLRRLVDTWPFADWDVEVHPTRCPEHAGVLVCEMLDRPPDLLAVCGGDGTLNEVISSVPRPPFPVALIPGGTANVLAHELGLPRNPVAALEVALKRTVRQVDLGLLSGTKRRPFLLMAGIGFDAHVVLNVRPKKRLLGMTVFYLTTVRTLLSYSFPEFQVVTADEEFAATSCVISNARTYGGGIVFTPDADMTDGLFDVLIVKGKPGISHLKFFLSAWRRKPRPFSCVQWRRVPAVKIKGPRGLWVQVDGELFGSLPVEANLLPASYPLVVPAQASGLRPRDRERQ